MRHFDLVGKIDIEPIVRVLPLYKELFDLIRFRQGTPGSPHVDTETLFLRMPPELDRNSIFECHEVIDYPTMNVPEFSKAVAEVARLAYAKPARAMIVSLHAGGYIRKHIDEGSYAVATDRYHLCLTTNPQCSMRIGNEVVYANPEEVWWFDKSSEHSVANAGNTPRLHLIVDMWRD